MSSREPFFIGSFYPSTESENRKLFSAFEKMSEQIKISKTPESKAIIVPHAGYVYSGFTASLAYSALKKTSIKNVVIIGPSHHHYFEGISVGDFDTISTPFGDIKYAKELANSIREEFDFIYRTEAHAEHSTEVQFPFIKYYLEGVNVVEVVYGKCEHRSLIPAIEKFLDSEECGVVISTDLSHFYTLDEAKEFDSICMEGVKNSNIYIMDKGCEACGKIGVKAMMEVAKKKSLTPTILDYRTSADASGDNSRVVGYMSAIYS